MNNFLLIKALVVEWTLKAQNSSCTDDERATYYECAEQLHRAIQRVEESTP